MVLPSCVIKLLDLPISLDPQLMTLKRKTPILQPKSIRWISSYKLSQTRVWEGDTFRQTFFNHCEDKRFKPFINPISTLKEKKEKKKKELVVQLLK